MIYSTDATNELKTSVSEGKALVAAAVTDKGVNTAADATFQTIATNIRSISTGSGMFIPFSRTGWSRASGEQTGNISLSISKSDLMSCFSVDTTSGSELFAIPNIAIMDQMSPTGKIYFATRLSIDYSTKIVVGAGRGGRGTINNLIEVIPGGNWVFSYNSTGQADGVCSNDEFYEYLNNTTSENTIARGFRVDSFNTSMNSGTLSLTASITHYSAYPSSTENGVITLLVELK